MAPSELLTLISEFNIVVDCPDNIPSCYLLNDACVLLNKPLVYGLILSYEGQVSVFNFKNGPNYQGLYPAPPSSCSVPVCEEGRVLGVLPGITGCLQANEVPKIIVEIVNSLSSKLLILNTLTLETNIIDFQNRNQRELIEKLIE